jgi:hypothetical protein
MRGWRASRFERDAGASPLFPPRFEDIESAKEELLHTVRRDPRAFGIEGTRWTLEAIHQVCDWLRVNSPAGVSRLLDRLDVSWKRSRDYVHSPDPDYTAKLQYISQLRQEAQLSGGEVALVYMDEVTYYRQPTLANAYEERGQRQVLAVRSYRANTQTRVIGTLDPTDGRVVYGRSSKIKLGVLVDFYQKLCQAYPRAKRIYVVQDNWPEHCHPDVLTALEEQKAPWPWYRPSNWPKTPSTAAIRRWGELKLPIQVVMLPTYASWCNPIEKLWRKLRQELLHLHRLADGLPELRLKVDNFLDHFSNGSLELLRYVGLLAPN